MLLVMLYQYRTSWPDTKQTLCVSCGWIRVTAHIDQSVTSQSVDRRSAAGPVLQVVDGLLPKPFHVSVTR